MVTSLAASGARATTVVTGMTRPAVGRAYVKKVDGRASKGLASPLYKHRIAPPRLAHRPPTAAAPPRPITKNVPHHRGGAKEPAHPTGCRAQLPAHGGCGQAVYVRGKEGRGWQGGGEASALSAVAAPTQPPREQQPAKSGADIVVRGGGAGGVMDQRDQDSEGGRRCRLHPHAVRNARAHSEEVSVRD